MLRSIDIFGEPLPTFNLKGKTHVFTATGGIFTIILAIVFLGYTLVKFEHLIEYKNPDVTEFLEKNFYDYQTRIDLNEIGFKFAFTLEGYLDKKIKDDPKYVKLMARIF